MDFFLLEPFRNFYRGGPSFISIRYHFEITAAAGITEIITVLDSHVVAHVHLEADLELALHDEDDGDETDCAEDDAR